MTHSIPTMAGLHLVFGVAFVIALCGLSAAYIYTIVWLIKSINREILTMSEQLHLFKPMEDARQLKTVSDRAESNAEGDTPEPPSSKPILCPRCKGPTQPSRRHPGQYYCVTSCITEDGDNFYFEVVPF